MAPTTSIWFASSNQCPPDLCFPSVPSQTTCKLAQWASFLLRILHNRGYNVPDDHGSWLGQGSSKGSPANQRSWSLSRGDSAWAGPVYRRQSMLEVTKILRTCSGWVLFKVTVSIVISLQGNDLSCKPLQTPEIKLTGMVLWITGAGYSLAVTFAII